MNELYQTWDATAVMWIAATVAAAFVSIVLFDAFMQYRKNSRPLNRRRPMARAKMRA